MTVLPDIVVPQVGDDAEAGDSSYANVFGAIKDLRDTLDAGMPAGLEWQDWTPQLVAGNANAGNSWTPTDGSTNPTLGTGSHVEGRYLDLGELIIARATIAFGTAGVNAGNGAYRISLPVPCTAAARAATGRAIIGHGQIYDDSVASATFGLGPTVYRSIDLHTAETITTDVAGLLNTAGLPLTSLQSGGYTVASHTDRRTITETTITLAQLANVVGTIINDIAALLAQNVIVDVSNTSPWAWAANDRITVALMYERA